MRLGIPYDVILLGVAGRAVQHATSAEWPDSDWEGQLEIAVITAQMAAEIKTEVAIGLLLEYRGVPELDDPIEGLIPSYNLGNERVRTLYESLSGDQIAQTPFWPAFKEHVKRRNAVVHKGMRGVSVSEANESIQTVADLISHLDSVVGGLTGQPVH